MREEVGRVLVRSVRQLWRCPLAMHVCSLGNESALEVHIWTSLAKGRSKPWEGEIVSREA